MVCVCGGGEGREKGGGEGEGGRGWRKVKHNSDTKKVSHFTRTSFPC